MIRVFPRRTKATPTDAYAFVGDPPLSAFIPPAERVAVSCAFTWDKPEAERLRRAWQAACPWTDVTLGGPAYGDAGGEFVPGRFLRQGYVMTSRGCPNACSFCLVPMREGPLRELPVTVGHDVLDNNILACSDRHLDEVFAMLGAQKQRARFTGGLEARRVTSAVVDRLQGIRLECVFLAYDSVAHWGETRRAIGLLRDRGLSRDQVQCYVLAGFGNDSPNAAADRAEQVLLAGAIPYLMLWRPAEGESEYSREWLSVRRRYIRPAVMMPRGRRAELEAGRLQEAW